MSQVVSIRIPDNLRLAVEMKAKTEGESVTSLIKDALELSMKSNELEVMKTAHEKHIAAIEKVAESSSNKTKLIDNYLNLTEQRVRQWDNATKKGVLRYTHMSTMLCSLISAIGTIYIVLKII